MSEETMTAGTESGAAVESTPAAESTSTSTFQDNASWSDQEFIENAVKGLQGEETKTEETTASEEVAEVATEEAVEEVQEEAAEEATEEVAEEKEGEEEKLSLDLDDTFGPKELEAKINASPELKAAIDKDPTLKGTLFKNARQAKEFEAIKEVLPTKDAALRAVQDASNLREVDQAFYSGDPKNFMDALVKMATVTDAQGKSTTDPNLINFLEWAGKNEIAYHTQQLSKAGVGSISDAHKAFGEAYQAQRFGQLRKEAEQNGDEELKAALEIIEERNKSPRSGVTDEIPETVKQREAAIQERENKLARDEQQRQETERQKYETEVANNITDKIGKLVNPVLDKAALTPFARDAAEEKIHDRLAEALKDNADYQSRLKEIQRLPVGSDAKRKQTALVMEHAQAALTRIVKDVIKEATTPVLDAQKSKQAKQTAQQSRSKTEIQGSQIPATPKNLSGQDLMSHLENEYAKTHNGQKPDGAKLVELAFEYKSKALRG